MEKAALKSSSFHKKSSEEEVGRHPNSVSVENVEKFTIRTKNGLVNGVAEEKCKTSKKHAPAKSSIGANVTKELKKSKKGHSSGVQNNEINVSHSNVSKKSNSQKNNKNESSNAKNCITNVETSEIPKKIQATSLIDSSSSKEDPNMETNQLKPSQSESKSNEPPRNKTESKRKKSKPKLSKTGQNMQIEDSDFNLPKFDITSIINATVNNENLLSKVPLLSENTSSGQGDTNKSYLLEYQESSSEFEKDLIESIKNLKIQQQDGIATEMRSTENPIQAKLKEKEAAASHQEENLCDITYVQYESELQMPMIMRIIQKDLSEPYSIYTYRYFIHNWPKLCFLAMCEEICVGAIVCKLDFHRKSMKRGYIAMLAVDKDYRKRRIGSTLVRRAITQMIAGGADEVVLETEVTNKPALRLYEQLGFVRDKRLFRYYLNGVDALRLKLWLR